MGRLGSLLLNWGPTLVCNIVLPVLTYSVLTDHGTSTVIALAISGVWPLVELAVLFAIRRRIDDFGILTLVFIVAGVAASLFCQSERVALIKESAGTGVFGLALLGSLLTPRPLMFYFGRKFATDGSPERVAWTISYVRRRTRPAAATNPG